MDTQIALTTGGGRDLFAAIERADLAASTRQQYRKALAGYINSGGALTDVDALAEHAGTLSQSGRAFLKAAVRLWTAGFSGELKGGATPENLPQVQAALYRLEAIETAIAVSKSKGVKAHTWLTQADVRRLLATCDTEVSGLRDRVVLGLLVAAGLRRQEAAMLTFDDVKVQPVANRMRTVLAVKGKGAKDRIVPISDSLGNALRHWGELVGDGRVCRRLTKRKGIGDALSPVGVFNIVRRHGEMMDKPELAPHDLRRTYAQLGYEAGVPITQISILLGHANVATTQRYLNLELDLETTASDFVPFE